jgi:hypothetical protein
MKDQILELFEKSTHQADILVGIYKLYIPDWDNIKSIENWPTCGEEMWLFICDEFIKFDKLHHESYPGGLWLNNGFSTDKTLDPWAVDLSTCRFIRT